MSHSLAPSFLDRSWWDTWDYPTLLWDQNFGTVLSNNDLHPPMLHQGYVIRPRTRACVRLSGESEVKNDIGKFVVRLNVKHFGPKELEVKVCNNHVVINGKHEERSDEHGSVERNFSRHYVLPEDTDMHAIKSSLSSDGILTIEAPKKAPEESADEERIIPIIFPKPSVDKRLSVD